MIYDMEKELFFVERQRITLFLFGMFRHIFYRSFLIIIHEYKEKQEQDMKTFFYVDVYFILNLMVNISFITLTAWFRKKKVRLFRIFLCSALVSLCSSAGILFLWNRHFFLVLSAVLEVFLLVGGCFAFQSISGFFKDVFCFFLISVLAGGMITVFYNICSHYVFVHSFLWFFGSLLLFLSAAWLWKKEVFVFLKQQSGICPVVLYRGDKRIEARALYDTGNKLYSPYTGEGVTVINENLAKRLGTGEEYYQMIPYHSLGGTGLLRAFYIDAMELKEVGERREHVLVAVSDSFGGSEKIEVILNEK